MAHKGRLTTVELAKVFDEGQALNHRWFTLRVLYPPDPAPMIRWGIAVGKRLAGGGVERNRLRRRVSASTRMVDVEHPAWVVVQLRREGSTIGPLQMAQAIRDRLQREFARQCTGD
jgi:ribonuclease P protein component